MNKPTIVAMTDSIIFFMIHQFSFSNVSLLFFIHEIYCVNIQAGALNLVLIRNIVQYSLLIS